MQTPPLNGNMLAKQSRASLNTQRERHWYEEAATDKHRRWNANQVDYITAYPLFDEMVIFKQDNGFRYFSSRWGLSLCACRPRVVAPPSRHHPHLGAANGLVRPSLLVVWEHMLTHCSRWLEGELSARPAEMAGFIFQCWNLQPIKTKGTHLKPVANVYF